LYAGAIAVPAYPPRNQRHAARLQTAVSVATDSQAAIALTTTAILSQVQSLLATKEELYTGSLPIQSPPESKTLGKNPQLTQKP